MIELKHIEVSKTYLLAVSGGIDSMVMADLFLKAELKFSVAHCNFQLRDEDADQDEKLVKDWCEKNKIPFFVTRFDTKKYAEENSISIQLAARELRYDFFYALLNEHKINFLATAHHLNDNIETVLFHFMRGTGIQGLTGIPAKTKNMIRPMLHISKEEILAYAKENNIVFREDNSNLKTDYTRNKIRLELIPQLEKIMPGVQKNMAQNIERLSEANELYLQAIAQYKKKLIEVRGKDFYIPLLKLKHISPLKTVLYELLKPFHFSFEQTIQAIQLMESQTGSFIETKTHRLFKNRNFFIITSVHSEDAEIIRIEKENEKINTTGFTLAFEKIKNSNVAIAKDLNHAHINADLLSYPLLLRKWRQGDYLYPLGMNKKKKIARVLIDAKIPQPEKENVWVLESDKKIVWIVGLKIDNRFKIEAATKNILSISLNDLRR